MIYGYLVKLVTSFIQLPVKSLILHHQLLHLLLPLRHLSDCHIQLLSQLNLPLLLVLHHQLVLTDLVLLVEECLL